MLDAGCGGQASGIHLLSRFRPENITAVDLSVKNVETSRRIVKQLGYQNVDIRQGNILNLEFENDSFDFVFSNGVIHHTLSPLRCFLELKRVVKNGGYVFIGVYGYGGLWGGILHPLGMQFGKSIPLSWSEWFVNKTGILRSPENSLLDWFYTPIQRTYKLWQIEDWFQATGFKEVMLIPSLKMFYRIGLLSKILFGDGYIFAVGRKST